MTKAQARENINKMLVDFKEINDYRTEKGEQLSTVAGVIFDVNWGTFKETIEAIGVELTSKKGAMVVRDWGLLNDDN